MLKVEHILDPITKRIIDQTPFPVIISKEGIIQYINPETCRFLGAKSNEQIIGKSILAFHHPKSMLGAIQRIEELKNNKAVDFVEETLIGIDGKKRLIRSKAFPVTIGEERLDYICLQDYQPQVYSKKIESDYKIITDNVYDIVFKVSTEGIVTFVSPSIEPILGFSSSEVLGKKIIDFIHPGDQTSVIKHITDTLNKIDVEPSRTRTRKKDGSYLWVETTASAFFNETTGEPEGLISCSRDITDRVKTEIELRNQKERLEQSEASYKNLVERLPEAIVISFDDTIIFVNEEAVNLMEAKKKEDLVGQKVSMLQFLVSGNDKVTSNEWRGELTSYKGTRIQVEVKEISTVFYGKECKLYSIRDLSENIKSQNLLIKSEKLSIAGQLAAGIAHEIRNPLTSLKGFLHLIKNENVDTSKYYRIMEDELNRIDQISSELIILAKPHSSHLKEINLLLLIEDVVVLMGTQAVLHNIQINVNYPDYEIMMNCYETQIKQVFINLIKNSIESMENDSGVIEINISLIDDEIVIMISDNGPGIDEEQLNRIGEPFYTTKDKGTGLGLMVTYKIIEEHNGMISVTSKKGIGTSFVIRLPLGKFMEE